MKNVVPAVSAAIFGFVFFAIVACGSFMPSSYTGFTVKVWYPDNSMHEKDVVTEVKFLDSDSPSLVSVNKISGKSAVQNIRINNRYLDNNGSAVRVASLVFDNDDMNVEMDSYAGPLRGPMITGVYFDHTIRKNADQQFDLTFPKRLNAQLDHRNFSTNHPVLTWDPFPGVSNGYLIILLVKKKDRGFRRSDARGKWERIDMLNSTASSLQLFTGMLLTEGLDSLGVRSPSIVPGDIIRFEIFVLDGSRNAVFMDSLTIQR